MKSNTLLCLKTHVLTERIIAEYRKMQASGYDTLLIIDNSNNIFPVHNKKQGICRWYGCEVRYLLMTEEDYKALNLPFISHKGLNSSFKNVMWMNCDYPYYLLRLLYPEYKFIWQFEYDCYLNSKDYSEYLETWSKCEDDFLGTRCRKITPDSYWYPKTDWIYKDIEKYGAIFPITRLSSSAIDFLYKQRIALGRIFSDIYESQKDSVRWIVGDLFVPTELMKNGYSCTPLQPCNNVGTAETKDIWRFYSERKYLIYDNEMYHPIKKSDFFCNIKNDKLLREKILNLLDIELKKVLPFPVTSQINTNFNFSKYTLSQNKAIHYDIIFRGEPNKRSIEISLTFEKEYTKFGAAISPVLISTCNKEKELHLRKFSPVGVYFTFDFDRLNMQDIQEYAKYFAYLIEFSLPVLLREGANVIDALWREEVTKLIMHRE